MRTRPLAPSLPDQIRNLIRPTLLVITPELDTLPLFRMLDLVEGLHGSFSTILSVLPDMWRFPDMRCNESYHEEGRL